MPALRGTLYAQITALFLLLLTGFCIVAMVFTAREFGAFLEELEQRLNLDLAANVAAELEPALVDTLQSAGARSAVDRILDINPAIDVYIVDTDGHIAATYANEAAPVRNRVDPGMIRKFLSDDPMLPLRAADPASAAGEKVFSAARIVLPGGRDGYLFIILQGKPLESAASMLQNSYIVRSVAFAIVVALLAVALTGFLLFSLLTRRFRRLTDTVRSFRDGNYERRVAAASNDEIGDLGRAVNDMAGTIQAQVEALRRTDDERRTLVQDLSHDFRTPLTSLRGYATRLLQGHDRLDATERDACLAAILSNTEQLEHLAAQLAAVSLLDANGDGAQMEPFSLNELVQDVTLKFQPAAGKAGVALLPQYSAQPQVRGDIGLIERVLSNLIDNAIRNTASGGTVRVSADELRDCVRVTVSDTGVGIEADELALVTQRFYRTQRSRQTQRGGSGLGLAIANEILELHGSALELQSVPGSGTTAAFRLETSPAAQ